MSNKCIKLKIIKPYKDDCTWKELGEAFRNSSYACMKTANYVMIENLLRARKPKEEREPVKDFTNRLYAECVANNETIAAQTVNQAMRVAKQSWSTHGGNVLKGKLVSRLFVSLKDVLSVDDEQPRRKPLPLGMGSRREGLKVLSA